MADVWKMVRLLGKTAIEVKDDYQVALLVLASVALEPESKPQPSLSRGRPATFAEAVERHVSGRTAIAGRRRHHPAVRALSAGAGADAPGQAGTRKRRAGAAAAV